MLIEVAYALPNKQKIIEVEVNAGCTLEEAIKLSGILDLFLDIDLRKNKVGIFGDVKPLKTSLAEQDRVEIYRALIIAPMEARRQRAIKKVA